MATYNTTPTHSPSLAHRVESSLRAQLKHSPGSRTPSYSPQRRNIDFVQNTFLPKNDPIVDRNDLEYLNLGSYVLENENPTNNVKDCYLNLPGSGKLLGEALIDSNYEIVSELGKGTFGKVYLAKKKLSNEYVRN